MSYDTIGVEVDGSVCEDLGNAWVVTVFGNRLLLSLLMKRHNHVWIQ